MEHGQTGADAFTSLTNDGDDEGAFFLERLPTPDEAAAIRKWAGVPFAPLVGLGLVTHAAEREGACAIALKAVSVMAIADHSGLVATQRSISSLPIT
jgi:hypothetical protein